MTEEDVKPGMRFCMCHFACCQRTKERHIHVPSKNLPGGLKEGWKELFQDIQQPQPLPVFGPPVKVKRETEELSTATHTPAPLFTVKQESMEEVPADDTFSGALTDSCWDAVSDQSEPTISEEENVLTFGVPDVAARPSSSKM